MKFKVHNTQTEDMSELSANFDLAEESIIKEEKDIDFDLIITEKEYFCKEIKRVQVEVFIGDKNDSTEIDSIVNSMISEVNVTANPFKLAAELEESGTEEILSILKKQPQTCKNDPYVRGLSRSNPEFYNKKVSLSGKVLRNEDNRVNVQNVQNVQNIHRCIPQRVSNPFSKNFNTNTKNSNFDSFLIKNNTDYTNETKNILY